MYIALGVILALFAMLALITATILVYLQLRKKYRHRRILNEVIIIGVAFLVCFGMRFAVVLAQGLPNDVASGMSGMLYVLYSTIGGLSFEGVDAAADLAVNLPMQICYYGAVVYAAVIMLLVISTGISYEFFSFVEMRGFTKKYKAVYVFTHVTQESLLLAEDIAHEEESKGGKNHYAILFMGEDLETFDRKNDIHRQIMECGYFYWSYGSLGKHSVLKRLRYTQANCKKRNVGERHNKMLHIFALQNDDSGRGVEGTNSDFVFDDVALTIADYTDKKTKTTALPTVVNYYLLTHGNINYEYYATRTAEIAREHANNFQLHILDEARLASVNMLDMAKLDAYAVQGQESFAKAWQDTVLPDDDGVYRIAVLGFGKIGQYAATELYQQTAHIHPQTNNPARFIADVYDKNATDQSGDFAYAHPMFLCKNEGKVLSPTTNKNLIDWADGQYSDVLNALFVAGEKQGYDKQRVLNEMALPIVALHSNSCYDRDFMRRIDSVMAGTEQNEGVNYRAFIVALGNDDGNVAMANLLIDDYKNQILLGAVQGDMRVKTIYVNVRDEKNVPRINWTEEDKKVFAGKLAVVPFGTLSNLYSYERIVNDVFYRIYNYSYEYIGATGKLPTLKTAEEQTACNNAWLKVSCFAKESNRAACDFGFHYYLMKDKNLPEEYFSRIEHERWNRFHIANGWIFADYNYYVEKEGKTQEQIQKEKAVATKNKNFRRRCKQHQCLCPFDMLEPAVIKFDYANVQIGMAEEKVYPLLDLANTNK